MAIYHQPAIVKLAPLESGWKVVSLFIFPTGRGSDSGDNARTAFPNARPKPYSSDGSNAGSGRRHSFWRVACGSASFTGVSALNEWWRSKAGNEPKEWREHLSLVA